MPDSRPLGRCELCSKVPDAPSQVRVSYSEPVLGDCSQKVTVVAQNLHERLGVSTGQLYYRCRPKTPRPGELQEKHQKMLKMAPQTNSTVVGKTFIVTCVIGVYAVILASIGVEMYQDYATYKPGVPHFDQRQASPEAQRQMFSLKD